RNSKLQIPSSKGGLRIGAWNLGFLWCLELGVCCLGSLIGLPVGYLQEAQIMPHAHRTKPDVEIGEGDPEQTDPRPEHVSAIEAAHAAVRLLTERRLGKLIDAAADQVPQGMTAEGVTSEQNHVQGQHDGSDADAELCLVADSCGHGSRKPHRLPDI